MRLDKYLKVSRLFKRRSVAKDIAEDDRVFINGRHAKPSSEVQPGDEIKIVYGMKILRFRVLIVADQAKKDDASKMYEILEETRTES
ncbi:MAG TPA: RNA-binding S4 domain-containing protein [Candidatus Izemoplasmatales bacterium]|nr:RNA-binding S4 domain-containing protein [Bacillota bacterium]HRY77445.1 RNA-binding S4 domain-containing protein [Candidatus Izemoplasmatales bacterium]